MTQWIARYASIALICLAAATARADGITASVDRTEISLQDTLQLTVTVDGSQSAQPALPQLPQFEVHGRGQSTQVHIVNGHMSTSGTYAFELIPRQTGTFTIGAARVVIDGKPYTSEPFTVKVTQAAAAPQETGQLFVTADVSTHDPYVGEQIVFTWRFYRRVRIGNASIAQPNFDGFWVQDLGNQRDYQMAVRGQQYLVTEIRKALFAQEVGPITIPAVNLDCDVVVARPGRADDPFGGSPFDEMFGRVQHQNKSLRTAPIQLNVQPLPAPPPGYSNLVGQFQIHAELSQSQLRVGDSATLNITISGVGNAQNIGDPQLPELAGFKVYDDKPTVTLNNKGDALSGSKLFKKALVPTKAGTLTIPSVTLTYFDPTTKSYQTRNTQPFTLRVSPGADTGGANHGLAQPGFPQPFGKTDVKLLGDDLLPIYKHTDALRGPVSRLRERIALGCLFMLPQLIALAIVLWQRRQESLRDPTARRRRDALSRGIKASGEVKDLVAKGQIAPAAVRASRGVREYLGDKLGLEGLALTPYDARERLQAQGVAEDLARRVEAVLQRCEAAQYGADLRGKETWGALPNELKTLLNQLDRTLHV